MEIKSHTYGTLDQSLAIVLRVSLADVAADPIVVAVMLEVMANL